MQEEKAFGQREQVTVVTDRHQVKSNKWIGNLQSDIMRAAFRKAFQVTMVFVVLLAAGLGGYMAIQAIPKAIEVAVPTLEVNIKKVIDTQYPARGDFISGASDILQKQAKNNNEVDVSGGTISTLKTLYQAYLQEQWRIDPKTTNTVLQAMADNRVIALRNLGLLDARKSIADVIVAKNLLNEPIPARWLSTIYEQDLQIGAVQPQESSIFMQDKKLFILLPLLSRAADNEDKTSLEQRNTMRAFLRGLLLNNATGVSTAEQGVPLAKAIVDYLLLRQQEKHKGDYLTLKDQNADSKVDPVATRMSFKRAWNTPSDRDLLAKIKQLQQDNKLVILPESNARQLLWID